jgi:serine/threonine-protein kinase
MAFIAGAVLAPAAFRTPRFVTALGTSAQPVIVPQVTGFTRQDARREIETANLVLAGEWSEYGPSESAGQVIRQDPAAGTQVPRGSPVNVFWNIGPLFRPYHPELLPGLTASEAEELIADWQLYTAGRSRGPHATVPEGRVIAVSPPYRDSLPVYMPVRLLVSTGWEGVPLFTGMSLSEADSIALVHELVLSIEGFDQVGESSRDSLISAQIPSPGTSYMPGDTVLVRLYVTSPGVIESSGVEQPEGWGQW